jgi:hypothetical protein
VQIIPARTRVTSVRIEENRRIWQKPGVARDLHSRRRMHAAIELAGFAAAQAPYRPHHDPQEFAVHRPKFVVTTPEGHDVTALRDAFFKGVESHPMGRRVWQACADESW